MYIGNIVLLVLNLPLIPYIARVLALPSAVLVPYILFFSLIGVYFVSFNTFDIHLMVLFAIVALVCDCSISRWRRCCWGSFWAG
jgi:putative tricarboxylic transport membrane protein